MGKSTEHRQRRGWIKIGIVCGLLVSIIYPAIIFAPLPTIASLVLIALFGPLLSLASAGLYYFLRLSGRTIAATIGLYANLLAGMLITTMLLVQVAIRSPRPSHIVADQEWIWAALNYVHLGLDVSWDVYIAIGTFCFALAMVHHPRLGKGFAFSGIAIAALIFVLNLATFPDPPANSGLFDAGPLVGLWYLAVTIRIMTSSDWIELAIEKTRSAEQSSFSS